MEGQDMMVIFFNNRTKGILTWTITVGGFRKYKIEEVIKPFKEFFKK